MKLHSIFARVDRYLGELFAAEDEALAAVDQSIETAGMPPIGISAVEGKLLHVLARACGARRILEIGTLAGYSTIWLARALPPDGTLVTIEVSPEYARVAQRNLAAAGVHDRVAVRVGRALDVLPQLADDDSALFDMVFIDADKPPYVEYFEWSLRLARVGALIVADNVIRSGRVLAADDADADLAGIRRFNAHLAASRAVSATALQTVGPRGHDGLALAVVL
jgi:caffeoyl-CoA O-methyltransferase